MITKGWVKNNESGEIMSFQYNPTSLSHARGASYTEISAPGTQYPGIHYVKGNSREFSVELFMNDNPSTGLISRASRFLNGFLPPEYEDRTFTSPPTLTFCYGRFIKKCVLTELSESTNMMDGAGNPTQTVFTLTLRQVSE